MLEKLTALAAGSVLGLGLAGCGDNDEHMRLDRLVDVTVGDELVLDDAPPGVAARRAAASCKFGVSPRLVEEHVVRGRDRLAVCRTAEGTPVAITP